MKSEEEDGSSDGPSLTGGSENLLRDGMPSCLRWHKARAGQGREGERRCKAGRGPGSRSRPFAPKAVI